MPVFGQCFYYFCLFSNTPHFKVTLENLRRDTKLFMNKGHQHVLKKNPEDYVFERRIRSKFTQVSCSCPSKQGVLPSPPPCLSCPGLRRCRIAEREAGGCIRSSARERCSVHDPCFPFAWLPDPQTLVTRTTHSCQRANDIYSDMCH